MLEMRLVWPRISSAVSRTGSFCVFKLEVLGQAGDPGYRVPHFMSHPCGQASHGGQAFAVDQLLLQAPGFGLVFHQYDGAALRMFGTGDGALVQVEPVRLAAQLYLAAGKVVFSLS